MTFIRRIKIKKKTSTRYRVVVVVGDDADTNLANTVEVSLPTIEGQPIPSTNLMKLPLRAVSKNGDKRFVFDNLEFSDDAVNFAYDTFSTMKDSVDEPVGAPLKAKVEVTDDGDSRVRSASIIQKTAEKFRLRIVVIGDSEDNVSEVGVSFADFSGPAPIPEYLQLKKPINKNGKKIFINETLTFEEPAAAGDEMYFLVIELFDIKGRSLGSSEYSVMVEGLYADEFEGEFDFEL